MEALPGFEDFQVDATRVSFVARPEQVALGLGGDRPAAGGSLRSVKKAS